MGRAYGTNGLVAAAGTGGHVAADRGDLESRWHVALGRAGVGLTSRGDRDRGRSGGVVALARRGMASIDVQRREDLAAGGVGMKSHVGLRMRGHVAETGIGLSLLVAAAVERRETGRERLVAAGRYGYWSRAARTVAPTSPDLSWDEASRRYGLEPDLC